MKSIAISTPIFSFKSIANTNSDTALIKFCKYEHQYSKKHAIPIAVLSYMYEIERGGVKVYGWSVESVVD